MSLLAPSLAAAFLGCLAFVAWLLWLRRTDERRHLTAELAKAAAAARTQAEDHAAALRKVDERVRKLEMKAAGLGGGG